MIEDLKSHLRSYIGELSEEEKEQVTLEIQEGANPTNDFFVMLIISAIIVAVGLLTNSAAVIIGAMLVSPLLMPIVGISLGAVKGDFTLFRKSVEAEAKGIVLVLMIVIIIALSIPNAAVTSEIALRTKPTPLDLVVALASGGAAAYAVTRKNISAALPGVAIAVALLPPLAVAGIGFALKMPEIAIGGGLMFVANIVAINFAASVVFWFLDFSPRWSLTLEEDTLQKLKTSAILLLVILLPLAWIMYDSISDEGISAAIKTVINSQLEGLVESQLMSYDFEYSKNGGIIVSATIVTPNDITPDKAEEIRFALQKKIGREVKLKLHVDEIKLMYVQAGELVTASG